MIRAGLPRVMALFTLLRQAGRPPPERPCGLAADHGAAPRCIPHPTPRRDGPRCFQRAHLTICSLRRSHPSPRRLPAARGRHHHHDRLPLDIGVRWYAYFSRPRPAAAPSRCSDALCCVSACESCRRCKRPLPEQAAGALSSRSTRSASEISVSVVSEGECIVLYTVL